MTDNPKDNFNQTDPIIKTPWKKETKIRYRPVEPTPAKPSDKISRGGFDPSDPKYWPKPSEAEIDELDRILLDFKLHKIKWEEAKSKIQRMIVEAKGEPEVVVGFLAPGDLVNGKVWPTHCKIVQLNKAELERKLG